VAAILIFFACDHPAQGNQRKIAHRLKPIGGSRKGAPALLRGEPAASMRVSAVGWRAACVRRGGNPPGPAFPMGETGNGVEIPCCRRRFHIALIVCMPLLSHALSLPNAFPDDCCCRNRLSRRESTTNMNMIRS
jgi:hypothetical protein